MWKERAVMMGKGGNDAPNSTQPIVAHTIIKVN